MIEKVCQKNRKQMLLFQSLKEKGIDGLGGIQRNKATGACNEDSGENAGEQNKRISNDR